MDVEVDGTDYNELTVEWTWDREDPTTSSSWPVRTC